MLLRIPSIRGTVWNLAAFSPAATVESFALPTGVSMCMRVQPSTRVTRVYDPDTGTIIIPAGLAPSLTLRAVKEVVAELHLPTENGTPLCWCGELLTISGLIPEQRNGEEDADGA